MVAVTQDSLTQTGSVRSNSATVWSFALCRGDLDGAEIVLVTMETAATVCTKAK